MKVGTLEIYLYAASGLMPPPKNEKPVKEIPP